MIALLQRVTAASVTVDGERIAAIGRGLLVFVGVERRDGDAEASRLAERILAYRVFPDADGRMNLSVADAKGGVLLVPQFTLAADTNRGNRPSFGAAAEPAEGRRLFDVLVGAVAAAHAPVTVGRFGAHMQVVLTNDGPVTIELRVRAPG